MDTSTLAGSVALVEDGVVLAEVAARMRATHSEEILPVVDEVLRRASVELGAVDVLAAGVGPGSFTGVRIGLATAKGLQLATGKRLVGVGSLEALAAAAVGASGALATVLDARRDEVFYALWRGGPGAMACVLGPACEPPEAAGARMRAEAGAGILLAIGDPDATLWARFRAGACGDVVVLPSVAGAPLARFVAHVAAARGSAGAGAGGADEVEPVYVRPSDAKLPGA